MDIAIVIGRFIIEELLPEGSRTEVDPDESLLSMGAIDSLALLRLIAFIEKQFDVTIEDHEVIPDNFETINRIKVLIESKMKPGRTAV
jgi:acyl carrier protein